jgi:hypothetical protein
MKEQFDDKAKDTTTIKSMPVEQTKASKDELSGVYHRGGT